MKVSTLLDYGVDKFFFLENKNADTSQRNVIFIARGECGRHAQAIAGKTSAFIQAAVMRNSSDCPPLHPLLIPVWTAWALPAYMACRPRPTASA